MNICDYGCGKEGKFKLIGQGNVLKYCCGASWQSCPASRIKLANNSQKLWMNKEYRGNHRQWNKGYVGEYGKYARIPVEELFTKNCNVKTGVLKKIIIGKRLKEYRCAKCNGGSEWMGEPLTLQLHHIDGDRTNALLENLAFKCPNCHTQTDNYAGRKLKKEKVPFICKEKQCSICGLAYKGLATHIGIAHNVSSKDYYDKYLKKDADGMCSVCGKETKFGTFSTGYYKTCSYKCAGEAKALTRRGTFLSEKLKRLYKNKENHPMYGKHPSEETKQKMKKPKSAEHCKKISINAKNRLADPKNNPMYGKKHSKESIELMRKNRGPSDGKNNSFYGKKHSADTLLKMSLVKIGKRSSRARLSDDQVREMRRLFEYHDYSILAKLFKMSVSGVKKIIAKVRYADVD